MRQTRGSNEDGEGWSGRKTSGKDEMEKKREKKMSGKRECVQRSISDLWL